MSTATKACGARGNAMSSSSTRLARRPALIRMGRKQSGELKLEADFEIEVLLQFGVRGGGFELEYRHKLKPKRKKEYCRYLHFWIRYGSASRTCDAGDPHPHSGELDVITGNILTKQSYTEYIPSQPIKPKIGSIICARCGVLQGQPARSGPCMAAVSMCSSFSSSSSSAKMRRRSFIWLFPLCCT